ncbi:LuxE/PaaK family acyltransferase [Marichromatium purpuratum]|uniref:LuxE/PaaK family acyltransferase n=1 Tax=Marichromatium purpuratum TaxID=37487 RepID=UPI00021E7100|nr:acyl-protein synthetase [Marichromatium purpuratum]
MSAIASLDALFELDAFAVGAEADQRFLAAVREVCAHHIAHCPTYRRLCEQEGFAPERLACIDDLVELPWIMVNVFKRHRLLSVPECELVATFTSSGTSGQQSQIAWDQGSMARQDAMRAAIVRGLGLESSEPANYLVFAYAPEVAGGKGAAHAHSRYTAFAPAAERFFAIHADAAGAPVFRVEECLEQLARFAESGLALRVIGFPAFAWRMLREMAARELRIAFPPGSLMILAGGWKAAQDEAVPRARFAAVAAEHLGIPPEAQHDVYGFVEHGVPYMTCEAGRFHVPVYARALTRRPGGLEPQSPGAPGLLQVISPYNLAQPALSVLATDYAIVDQGCPCGRGGDTLDIIGRAGVAKHQGCAITAAELLKS